MTYETKSGARYWVIDFKHHTNGETSARIQRKINRALFDHRPRQYALRGMFPNRESAENALKAYADAHRWKVVEG